MPWTLDDYPSSMKNLEKTTKKKAIDVANALLKDGYDEGRAIPIAIEQAKEWHDNASKDEQKDFLRHGDVTEHHHRYSSNPELLDENEMVISHKDGWAVQSKNAKKAAKVFEKKEDAIEYGKEIAQNKQTKLEVYKQDGSLQHTVDYSE